MSLSTRNSAAALGLLFALGFTGSAAALGLFEIAPQAPTQGDVVSISYSLTWYDSCVPRLNSSSVTGLHLAIFITPDRSEACISGSTDFSVATTFGPLVGGTYTVNVFLLEEMFGAGPLPALPALLETTQLIVTPAASELAKGLTFEPPAPSDNEIVRVLVHGVWHDACPPVLVGSRLDGHRFEVDLDVPVTFAPCTQALTPFAFSLDLGPLDAGSYDVEVFLHNPMTGEPGPLVWQMGTFEVSDQPDTVYLHGGRFAVDVRWVDFAGTSGPAKLIPNSYDESAFLYFFQPDNAEMIVKVIDACTFNDHFWVFVAAATNVEYRITVLDTFTGVSWIYENPLGVRSPAIADTRALAVCP